MTILVQTRQAQQYSAKSTKPETQNSQLRRYDIQTIVMPSDDITTTDNKNTMKSHRIGAFRDAALADVQVCLWHVYSACEPVMTRCTHAVNVKTLVAIRTHS